MAEDQLRRAPVGQRAAQLIAQNHPALDEVHAEIALLKMRGSTEMGEPGKWLCWRPGEESFEHLLSAVRHGDPSSGCEPGGLA
ncbi:MAG: hypothetical protein V9F04_08255 [Dermatophilaceae bacterium]